VRDVFLISILHEDRMTDLAESRGVHEENKPMAVIDHSKHKIIVGSSSTSLL
jgi:hypothetical protein